jgi:multiple sugar transport system permease protein
MKLRTGDRGFVLLLLAPAATFMGVLVAYPVFDLIRNSLFGGTLAAPDSGAFVGLANYAGAIASPQVQGAAVRTVLYTLIVVPCELVLGIAAALIFNAIGARSAVFRTIFAFPLMIAPLVAGLLWKFLLSDNFGIVNWILHWVGILPSPTSISWLSDPNLVLFSVAVPDIWLTTSFVALVVFAGLQNIPGEILEAARIDGAGYFQALRHVTLPLLRPVLAVVLVIRGVDAAKTFDVIWLQTQGGPAFASEVLSLQIYRTTVRFGDLGQGAAIATMFLVALMVVAIVAVVRVWRPGQGVAGA